MFSSNYVQTGRGIRYSDYENKLDYNADKKAWRQEESRLKAVFRFDLIEYLGLTGHPKADKLFEMAWERGHSGGYSEVLQEASDLAELLKD